MVRRFNDLHVYEIAFQAASDIYQLSKAWPTEERYALIDQIRRSSRSVCANIAEAWRKRRHRKHFISKLSDSEAEAAETRVWMEFARDCGYLSGDDFNRLNSIYHKISAGLVKMMRHPKRWCGPESLVNEPEYHYPSPTDHPPRTPRTSQTSQTSHART